MDTQTEVLEVVPVPASMCDSDLNDEHDANFIAKETTVSKEEATNNNVYDEAIDADLCSSFEESCSVEKTENIHEVVNDSNEAIGESQSADSVINSNINVDEGGEDGSNYDRQSDTEISDLQAESILVPDSEGMTASVDDLSQTVSFGNVKETSVDEVIEETSEQSDSSANSPDISNTDVNTEENKSAISLIDSGIAPETIDDSLEDPQLAVMEDSTFAESVEHDGKVSSRDNENGFEESSDKSTMNADSSNKVNNELDVSCGKDHCVEDDHIDNSSVSDHAEIKDDQNSSVSDNTSHEVSSGQPSKAEKVAADRDRKNPAYIPRTGKFFMHDEREGDDITLEEFESSWFEKKRIEQEQLERRKGRIRYGFNGDRWGNDKFNERLQSPKTYEQIVSEYGYDIREDGQALRKKYWDSSYKYDRTDNREWNRRPRREGNQSNSRGRRSGGRGRPNYRPTGRGDGCSNRPARQNYPEREPAPKPISERTNTVTYGPDSSHESRGSEVYLSVNRGRLPNDVPTNGRGKVKPPSPQHRREFQGKTEYRVQDDRRNQNKVDVAGQGVKPSNCISVEGREHDLSTSVEACSRNLPSSDKPQSSVLQNSHRSVDTDSHGSTTFKPSSNNDHRCVDTSTVSPKSSEKTSNNSDPMSKTPKEPSKTSATVVDESKNISRNLGSGSPSDPLSNNSLKTHSETTHPSNKRYSAQRRERKVEREGNSGNSRRPPHQFRQQPPLPHNNTHTSQMRSSTQQQTQSQKQRLSPHPTDSQQQQPQIPMSQMPQQQAIRPDVAGLSQLNYPPMHGGLDYPHPAMVTSASVMPPIPQQDLAYFAPPPTSVHPQYLLNYFRAIPADPSLQFFAQQQVAAAAAALANGQYAPSPTPAAADGHFSASESAGGTVFFTPIAQHQQQQPPQQITPERPRRALPIVAPSAGTDN